MRYGAETSKTTTSGSLEAPQQFAIQNSQIAFETLSSRLYTDPIRAVIRELSCNAYDAHVAAGKKEEPFEVSLPTNFDPSFRIRDYGTGMSHEQVLSLYCTYFASDKTKDNSVIGAFGLGSKSPFAYFLRNGKSGGFAVISSYGGKARTYAAYIDNGFPKVELQSEADTGYTGLEVVFPVEQRDVWEFENKAKMVFEFFSPLPKLNKHMDIQRPEYTIETKRWGLRKGTAISGVRAVMGGIAYTVGTIDVSRLSEEQQQALGMPLDIFYSIGEVNPAVSRESLQLDARTIDAIKKSLDEVYGEILEQVKSKVDAAASLWEGKMVIWDMLQHTAIAGIISAASKKGQLSGQYANFTLDSTDKGLAVNELDFPSIQAYRYERSYRRRGHRQREDMFILRPEQRTLALDNIKSGLIDRKEYECSFKVDPEVAFVMDDIKPGRSNKYAYAYAQNRGSDNPDKQVVYLISPRKDASQKDALAEMDSLLSALGNPPVTLASALQERYAYLFPKRAYAPRERGVLRFDETFFYSSRSWRHAWRAASAEQVGTGDGSLRLYVTIEGRNREPQDVFSCGPEAFSVLLGHLRDSGLFGIGEDTVVFGLRKNAKLRREKGWAELRGYVLEAARRELTPVREASLSLKVNPFETAWEPVLDYIGKNHPLDSSSPLQVFADSLAAAKKALGKTGEHLAYVLSLIGMKASAAVDFNEGWAKVEAQYPIIDVFGRKGYGSMGIRETDAFVGYARMVDQARAAAEPQGPTKDGLRRARKARNQKAYCERKRQEEIAAQVERQAAAAEDTVALPGEAMGWPSL